MCTVLLLSSTDSLWDLMMCPNQRDIDHFRDSFVQVSVYMYICCWDEKIKVCPHFGVL